MLRKKMYIASALVWLLVLQTFGQTTDKAYSLMLKGMYSQTVPQLKPEQLSKMLQNTAHRPLLLDTRTPAEYKVSHLSGAKLIDYDTFKIDQLKHIAKDTPIIVYCSVGYRSERVGEQLQQEGYKNVRNLYGGLFEWVNRGYPVFNKSGKTDQVHAYSKTWGKWLQKGEKVYE